MNKSLQEKAYNLGVLAYKNGRKCIPAWDKELAENCLKGCQVGEGIPYIKAWIKGWTDTNLKNPDCFPDKVKNC